MDTCETLVPSLPASLQCKFHPGLPCPTLLRPVGKFHPGLPCPTLLLPVGRAPRKRPYSRFRGGPPTGQVACGCLLLLWTPLAVRPWSCPASPISLYDVHFKCFPLLLCRSIRYGTRYGYLKPKQKYDFIMNSN
jgi:hypothetical protein